MISLFAKRQLSEWSAKASNTGLTLRHKEVVAPSGMTLFLMVVISVCIVASDNRFWMFISTWRGGSYYQIGAIVLAFAVFLLGILLFREKQTLFVKQLLPCVVFMVMILIYYRLTLEDGLPLRMLFLGILIYLLLSLSLKRKRQLLLVFAVVFALWLGLGLLFYVLKWAGFDLSSGTLISNNALKVAAGQYYSISPLGVVLNKSTGFDYCGVFDESGCLGTYTALVFIACNETVLNNSRIFRLSKILLIIEGVVTFSLAFYLLMIVYLVYLCVVGHRWRALVAILVGIAVLYLVMNVQIQSETVLRFQQRVMAFFDDGAVMNNRQSVNADVKMLDFFNSKYIDVQLFGYGSNAFALWQLANGVDGCSLYYYLYDRGYVGMFLYFLTVVSIYIFAAPKRSRNIVFLVVFALSAYQRPEIYSSIYMLLLVVGASTYKPSPLIRLSGKDDSDAAADELQNCSPYL